MRNLLFPLSLSFPLQSLISGVVQWHIAQGYTVMQDWGNLCSQTKVDLKTQCTWVIRGRLLTAPGVAVQSECFRSARWRPRSLFPQRHWWCHLWSEAEGMNSNQWADSTLICLLLKHYTLQRDVLCLYITLALRRSHSNKIDRLSRGDTAQKGLSLWFVWELCHLFKRDCEIVTRFNPKAGREYLTAPCLLLCMTLVYLAPFQNLSLFHPLQISFLSGLKLFHFPIKFPLYAQLSARSTSYLPAHCEMHCPKKCRLIYNEICISNHDNEGISLLAGCYYTSLWHTKLTHSMVYAV